MADPAAPAVSAIIVVLNGERFLPEAIDSVLAQTLDDWELLVVDDGSTDRTADIVTAYADRMPGRVRLLAHADRGNHGIAASRNLAIGAAQGRTIAFLDADDVWEPEKLADQVAILDADPELGLVYGRTRIWHSWDPDARRTDHFYPLGVAADRRWDPPVLFDLLLRNEAQTPTTCNAMMRASLFRAVGGFDASFPGLFEDVTFFAKALAVAPAYVSDRIWASYRQHDASCTAKVSATGAAWLRLRLLGSLMRSIAPLRPTPAVRRVLRRRTAGALAVAVATTGRAVRRRLIG